MAAGEQQLEEPFVVFLVGAEGSGKSTLFAQISHVVSAPAGGGDGGTVVLLDATAIPAVPTAGQEFHTLNIDTSRLTMSRQLAKRGAMVISRQHTSDEREQGSASGPRSSPDGNAHTRDTTAYRGVVPKARSDRSPPRGSPSTAVVSSLPVSDPEMDAKFDFLPVLPRAVVVNVRELGGGVAPSWGKFISSRMQQIRRRSDTARGVSSSSSLHALIFTVDVTSLSQLPLAATEFLHLMLANDDVAGWTTRVLLLLTKCASPFARVTRRDVDSLFLAPLRGAQRTLPPASSSVASSGVNRVGCETTPGVVGEQPSNRVDVLAVDAWVGLGVNDVVDWLLTQAIQR